MNRSSTESSGQAQTTVGGDLPNDFANASLFSSLNDADQRPHNFQPLKTSSRMNTKEGPKPWMRLPWYKRLAVVPYLFLMVWVDYARRVLRGLRWFSRQWMQAHPGALTRAGETVLWPLAFIALSQWSNPDNPLYVNEGFPWPWLGVWLVALRYGALSAVVGTLLLMLAWYGFHGAGQPTELPRLYFLGGAIMALIAGEFGSLWGNRAERQQEAMRYLDERIERLTRRLYLLKLSHDELEFEMVERPATLRDALAELQVKLNALRGERTGMPGASLMMDFWAAHSQIEVGAIYAYTDGPNAKLIRAASVGACPELSPEDPMLQRAVESGQAVHLLDRLSDLSTGHQALVICPMKDTSKRVYGALVVYRLPFMAFNADNLRNLNVLVDGYAAWQQVQGIAMPLLEAWPNAPQGLVQEFAWLQHLHRVHGIDSGCIVWQARGKQASFALESVAKLHANATMAWHLGASAIVTLSPFLGRRRLAQHEQNVLEAVVGQLTGHESAQLQPTSLILTDPNTWVQLREWANSAPANRARSR